MFVRSQVNLGCWDIPAGASLYWGAVSAERKNGGDICSGAAGIAAVAALWALGGISVCAVQLFFSLVIRAFAPPVTIGLIGGILGLLVTAQGLGYAFPYSLLCLGMRANNPQMKLQMLPFFFSTLIYTAVFAILAVGYIRRWDAAAE